MKSIFKFFLLLSSIALFSCTEEAFIEGTPSKGLTAQIPSFQFDNQTRVNISPNLSTFTWSDGDKIGIYQHTTYNDASAVFRINQGGSSSGVFSNESFSLKPNSTYYALYPYNSDGTVSSYPVDFTGQVQTANGSTDHIGARNYMSAEVNTDANGAANICFQNLAAVIQLMLPIEEAGNYVGVTLNTATADFISQGILNMKTGNISSKSKSQQMKVTFGQGLTMNEGETLTVNMLVAPVDLTGKTFSVVLETGAKTYHFENLEGMNIQKGKAYKVDCESGMIEETPYLTFTAEAEQTLTMSKAVETLEYSVNGGDWQTLGTNTVTFGGTNGKLQMRGKSSKGTASSSSDYSTISFGNKELVASSGDIRTLLDYENYKTVNTKSAKFCRLFQACTSLTTAPELPATTLASECYEYMFYGCTSLTTAPELPAIALAIYCYEYMFHGCTSLTTTPELPATTMEYWCYYHMFEDCTSLTTALELPATILANRCYWSMFQGCTSLTTAPELPATTLASECYVDMFYGCTSLTTAPKLPATTLANRCYESMFSKCTSLTTAPELPATILASDCYHSMFQGCTSLTTAPELPATTLTEYCYSSMFRGCTSLTTAPELPATTLTEYCYSSMFFECTSLTTAPKLPATNLAERCYGSMFSGCSSLTTAPELPAAILKPNCYDNMFVACSKLNYIKMMATDISASYCLNYWTKGVSSSGTFVKNVNATWTDRGASGIPSGWTVQTATE